MKQKLHFVIFWLILLFPAISSAQTLWAWGQNIGGQLGDGTTIDKYTPLQIDKATDWAKISAGGMHTVAIKKDGTLWAWGYNISGELGDGTTTSQTIPVQIGASADWYQVFAGVFHTMAIKKDGTLWAWGNNASGQLGDGTTESKMTPVQIGIASDWAQVSVGQRHTLALKKDGTLWGWGYNRTGQLGDGSMINQLSPIKIGIASDWAKISAGEDYSMAIKSDGTLWTWGASGRGELGDETVSFRTTPSQIGLATNWTEISAGESHSVALKKDGTLWAWGYNFAGQLGDGTKIDKTTPIQIGSDTDWIKISVGFYYTVGLKKNGTLWAWGRNGWGALGDGTISDRSMPVQVGTEKHWSLMSAGYYHVIALSCAPTTSTTNATICRGSSYAFNGTNYTEAGAYTTHLTNAAGCDSIATLNLSIKKSAYSLWTWGSNYNGELGNGTTSQCATPMPIGVTSDWVQVIAGGFHNIAQKSDGSLWAWGKNDHGQLGDGTVVKKMLPVQIGTATDWTQIAAGWYHTVALKKNGTIWAWGVNSDGELGDGTTVDKKVPVQIGLSTDWVKIATGMFETYAIKMDGTLWAWGLNNFSQLGLGPGAKGYMDMPTQVGVASDWVNISANRQVVATKKDGSLWAWGDNDYGQIGDGTFGGEKYTPIQIGTDVGWDKLTTGLYHTLAIKKDGTLWAWGDNYYSVLGDWKLTIQKIPAQIGTVVDWSQIDTEKEHTVALKKDGTLWVWGNNYYYQLGLGEGVGGATMPTQIGTSHDWILASAGYYHTVALRNCSVTRGNICQGEGYGFGGTTYTKEGTYSVNLTSVDGCDSTAMLILTVNQPTHSTTNTSICQGDSYTFNGTAYTTAGTYTTHLTNVAGCDSTATLILKVVQATSSTINAVICQGSSYSFNGKAYTTNGTYTAHLTNIGGCDSTATLILSVTPPPNSTSTATICQGSSYTFNGKTYTSAGTYSANLSSSSGCDSIATLIVKVNQPSGSSTNASICQGETYLFSGTSYAMAGTYTSHLTNAAGCDSTATLTLNVVPATKTEQTIYLANGESYTIGNSVYDATGNYTDVLKTGIGCDSVVVTHIVAKIPNTISPNEDGINDVFMKGCHVKIYNRNGLLLYEGDDGWNGTYGGKPVERDTYFYVLYLPGNSKKEGYITVIKK
jgi:gliding motility-associated-like protein